MSRPASKHRAEVRPRWGRIGLLTAAATVTLIAILAGFGLFSGSSSDELVATDPAGASAPLSTPGTPSADASGPSSGAASTRSGATVSRGSGADAADTGPAAGAAAGVAADAAAAAPASAEATALPADSGTGRRAVFSQSEQRVWIVGSDGQVERTYPVSGSSEDNLRPGTYHVYGKSRWAVGIDDSGVMQYFVRFAHGTDNGASIGFHTIPTKHGKPLQTIAQLGQRLSHGCIRQKTEDAIAMWRFAQVGTEVVVVA
jgi:lipoprotein-anchoring transpeptidase ErfK/SrfK